MNGSNRRNAETQRKRPNKFHSRISCLGVSASLRLVVLLALATVSCSIPNLEPSECDEARDVVREFYSLHFGNDMTFSPELLETRRRYLTERFYDKLRATPQGVDPFTRVAETPKAFRAGECTVIQPERRARFELLLFWKSDTETRQQSISVEAERRGETWLIDSVADEAS